MGEIREEKDQKIHEKKKKEFIREQLRPQRKKTLLRFLNRMIMVFGAAVLFGGIAAISFYIMRIYFPWQDFDDGIKVITSSRPPSNTVSGGKTISDEIDENVLDSLEGYEQISRQFAALGENANAAVVGLGKSDEGISGSHVRNGGNYVEYQKYCGILFHENAQYYYVLTEYASAQKSGDIKIGFYNGKVVDGILVGRDSTLNLAVFRVAKSAFSAKEQEEIVIASLGDGASLALGSYVLAVGKPNGNLFSVHSATLTEHPIPVSITDRELILYSTSIPYQAGRSGFVLNLQGQLLGMLTMSYTNVTGEVDTAFVSFSNLVPDINLLLQGKTLPYLGITGNSIGKEEAASIGLKEGVYVDSVDSGSPAYAGQIRVADVVTEVDGKPVCSMKELHELLAGGREGEEVDVTVYRQENGANQRMTFHIILK